MADGDRIPKVLVVDDEPNIRELVEVALKFHGCAVAVSASGKDALHQAEAYEPDLMILDVMLPDMDGFEVCRTLRADGNDVPVIFLTARDTTSDTIRGLTLGGDDYVTKPFSVEALVARVRAVLRRTARAPGGETQPGGTGALLQVGDLELDEEHWIVRRAGIPVELSPTEFRLLAYLMRNQGRMLTRQQLLENVWGWEFAGQSQVVETYVSYLRRKLDPLGPAADPHPARCRVQPARAAGSRAREQMRYTRRQPTGRGRLSLRSRLLAGLITITALFLIVMGVVTTVVLGNIEQDQFNTDLGLTVKESLSEIANLQNGYAAAYINLASRIDRDLVRAVGYRQRPAEPAEQPDRQPAGDGVLRAESGPDAVHHLPVRRADPDRDLAAGSTSGPPARTACCRPGRTSCWWRARTTRSATRSAG